MKALILAAGFGTRLAPITDNLPKSLVPVNGKPIIFKQIENLCENGITDITVISGYKGDVLEKSLRDFYSEIRIIHSFDYASTNNMYSAFLSKGYLYEQAFIMMNADVFFDSSVIAALLDYDADNAIVTDIGNYNEESMKVIFNNGRITSISKIISKSDALGSSIDVYKFSPSASVAFFDKCEEYIRDRGELKLWSEVALNDILSEMVFKPCPIKGRWFEIDNHEDLSAAEKLFKESI